MPTYEYACKSCGEHTDVVQSFTDDPLTVCQNCGGPLRKVFGNIGISFKGSGFYKNDSRSSSNGGSRNATPSTTSESGSSSTSSSDGASTSSSEGTSSGGGSSEPAKSSHGSSEGSGSSTPAPAPAKKEAAAAS
jgi:putative FmdB family regulatory protein